MAVWDTSGLLPVPRRRLGCPFCGGDLAVKDWKFHQRSNVGSKSPWRCDVRLKCMTCGHVPMFGVLVSEDMFKKGVGRFGRSWIHWRTGQEALREG